MTYLGAEISDVPVGRREFCHPIRAPISVLSSPREPCIDQSLMHGSGICIMRFVSTTLNSNKWEWKLGGDY
jgi:hypothetical protein